jgi:L-amino acid N-acyltransferase YncA
MADVELYEHGTAGLAVVVDPSRRGLGVGRSIIRAVASRPELACTRVLRGGVEPENRASVRCLEAVGFQAESQKPDEEGFIYFAYRIRQTNQ